MKQPLNYAILTQFLTEPELDARAVSERLAGRYPARRLKPRSIEEALMTAHANDLLAESRLALDAAGELRVFYQATENGRALIERYIGQR